MNDQLARSLFMDYLYDEISQEEKAKLETYLEDHPKLRRELNELQETRSLLQKMPEVDPTQQLLVMEPRNRTFHQWWQEAVNLLPQSFLGKTAVAAAAGFMLFFLIGSIAQLHIDTSGNGIAVSMGYSPTINQGMSKEQAEALVTQIREENAQMLSEYAKAINQQNREQLRKVVNYFQEQRINDLQLVDQTLDELQQNTNYRLYQTNEYLGEVLQTVSSQNQN